MSSPGTPMARSPCDPLPKSAAVNEKPHRSPAQHGRSPRAGRATHRLERQPDGEVVVPIAGETPRRQGESEQVTGFGMIDDARAVLRPQLVVLRREALRTAVNDVDRADLRP